MEHALMLKERAKCIVLSVPVELGSGQSETTAMGRLCSKCPPGVNIQYQSVISLVFPKADSSVWQLSVQNDDFLGILT